MGNTRRKAINRFRKRLKRLGMARVEDDTLLFLQAADTGSVMISRNSRDLDLLLQLKPQAGVLLYDKS